MELKVVLTIEEVNLVLEALSQKPFAVVNELITKIKLQGESQLKAAQEVVEVEEELSPVAAAVKGKKK